MLKRKRLRQGMKPPEEVPAQAATLLHGDRYCATIQRVVVVLGLGLTASSA